MEKILMSLIVVSLFSRVSSITYIELSIRHLVLRRSPHGCCSNGSECDSTRYCPLKFKLCLGFHSTYDSSSSSCVVLNRSFTLHVRSVTSDDINGTFTVLEFPQQRFDITSNAISQNVSVQMEIWNENDDKLLLFVRDSAKLSPNNLFPQSFKTWQYGTSLLFQLSAHCAPGFVGPGCDVFCKEPLPTEKFVCTPEGIQCLPGWSGPKCTRPVCDQLCNNGGDCVAPNQCQCSRGWRGSSCSECIPRPGCRNGFCTDEPGKCFCLPNWTGSECDIVVNKCLEKPCKNGGLCTTNGTHGDFFHCDCTEGFTGIDCSISMKVCDGMPCGRHGQCIPLFNSYTCTCASGYGGKDCRRRINVKPPLSSDEPHQSDETHQSDEPHQQTPNSLHFDFFYNLRMFGSILIFLFVIFLMADLFYDYYHIVLT